MSETQKFIGKKMNFFNLSLFPVAVAGSYFLLKNTLTYDFTKCNNEYSQLLIKQFPSTKWGFEEKLSILLLSGASTAVFLLFTVLFTMFGRMFSGRSGIGGKGQEDNLFISTCNRILKNTIEQSFIFYGLFAYWLFKYSGSTGVATDEAVKGKGTPKIDSAVIENGKLAVLFPLLFFGTRVCFFLGYMFHLFFKFYVIRGASFVLGLAVNVLILIRILGLENKYKLW